MADRLAALAILVILTIPGLQSSTAAFDPRDLTGSLEPFEVYDPPRQLPTFAFVDRDEKPMTLSNFEGRVVLLNMWATWCAPCIREMPDLDRLEALRGGDDFAVVALSLDRKGVPQVERFYKERGIDHLAIYVDKGMKSFRAFPNPVLPTSFIIGRDGRALGAMAGPAEWDSEQALALVDYFIAKDAAESPQEAATKLDD